MACETWIYSYGRIFSRMIKFSKSDIGLILARPILGKIIKRFLPHQLRGGLCINLDDENVPDSKAAAHFLKILERSEKKIVAKVIKKNFPIIEIGAGLGSVSLSICSVIDRNQSVLLLKPIQGWKVFGGKISLYHNGKI